MQLFEEWSKMSKIVAVSSLIFWTLIPSPAVAQIIPDSSLGAENSVVDSNGNRDTINGGAIRDANLFHSFQEFNVEALRETYFTNPDGINNIFSRVTGSNLSDIQGVLGVVGNANLYLINPNGILFGENARLDVNGSFFATTADSVLFENGFEFNAVNPDAPPLLTINIPIGLRFRDNPAPITNRSFVRNSTDTDFVGLEVPLGANLTFVGGDINFEAGEATALGGKIELGGLSQAGTVFINEDSSLDFPNGIERADITLTNAADIDVSGGGGGSITLHARNIELAGGNFGSSRLRSGIPPESSLTTAQAGDININATDTISVSQESRISNRVEESGVGNAGEINITTTNLSLTDGGQIDASTSGQGNAGEVKIKASESINVNNGADIFAIVGNNAQGNGGNIDIETPSLRVKDGSLISSTTFGSGNAGNISIQTENIDISNNSDFLTGILAFVDAGAIGNGGQININTDNLNISDEVSFISVSTLGQGDAGTINITASELINVNNGGDIWAIVFESAIGNAGQIDINSNQLNINSNSILSVSTLGQGDAGELNINISESINVSNGADIFAIVGNNAQGDGGNININTNNLNLSDPNSFISVSTLGQGDAGTINIAASESINVSNNSDIWAIVFSSGMGTGGNVNISTPNLNIGNGSLISTSNLGQGNAGNIDINSENIEIFSNSFSLTGILSITNLEVKGTSGNINISTDILNLTGLNTEIAVASNGIGNGGEIKINASQSIFASAESNNSNPTNASSGIFAGVSNANAVGNGGNINIITPNLSLNNGFVISNNILGKGDAGKITVNVNNFQIFNDSPNRTGLFSNIEENAQGNSGQISIEAENVAIENNSSVDTGIFAEVLPGGEGKSGNITIDTNKLKLNNFQSNIAVSSFSQGDAGEISINSSELIELNNKARILAQSNINGKNGGSIIINTSNLSLNNESQISSSTFGNGNAGNININTQNTEILNDSTFFTGILSAVGEKAQGNGGQVTLTTDNLKLSGNNSGISVSTQGKGDAGNINIFASESIMLNNNAFIATEVFKATSGIGSAIGVTGNGGDINIKSKILTLNNGGQITGNTFNEGNGGDINIEANSIEIFNNSSFDTGIFADVDSAAQGTGGNITITTDTLNISGFQSRISASTQSQKDAGDITIFASESIVLNDHADIISQVNPLSGLSTGKGGNVIIKTKFLSLMNSSEVSTNTFDSGKGGNLSMATETINLISDGAISTSTFGQGNAGNLTIKASESIKVEGGGIYADTTPFPSLISNFFLASEVTGNGGDLTIETPTLTIANDGIIDVDSNALGNAGNLFITTENLNLINRGIILASASARGNAGNIEINAKKIDISNESQIAAEINNGEGGNIELNVANLLQLSNNSSISAQAFNNSNGGNVIINADNGFIIAYPNQNNDIIASAEEGKGGEINITAEALFGIEERPLNPRTNDINASSEFGLDGSININTPTVDPTSGLLELTEEVVDPAQLIAQNVCTQTANSQFVDIGKGGLPQNPQDRLAEDFIEVGLVAPVITSSETTEPTRTRIEIKPKRTRKPPAQGWIFHDNGIVELVAYNPNQVGEQRTWDNHRGCQN